MIKLTGKQREALRLLIRFTYVLLFGGSRAGKTFIVIYYIFFRAMAFPKSRHLICRRYQTDVRKSIWKISIPETIALFELQRGEQYDLNEQDMEVNLSNGSAIICAGLDDTARLESVLGRDYVTAYQNEASDQSFMIYTRIETRLSQKVEGCKPKHIVDLNPQGKGHWTFKTWFKKMHPVDLKPLEDQDQYGKLWMSPYDNKENLAEGYIEHGLEQLRGDQRQRFLEGQYQDDDILLVFHTANRNYFELSDFCAWADGRLSSVRFVAGLDVGFQDADAFSILGYIDGDASLWLLYEYKAFREELEDLAQGIRKGLNYIAQEFPWYQNPQMIPIYSDTNTIRYGKEGDKKKNWSELRRVYGFNCITALKRDKDFHLEMLRTEYNEGNIRIPQAGMFDDETTQIVWHKNPIDGTIEHIIDDEIYHPDLMFALMYAFNYLLSYGNQALIRKTKVVEDKLEPYNQAAEKYEEFIREKENQEKVVDEMMELLNGD